MRYLFCLMVIFFPFLSAQSAVNVSSSLIEQIDISGSQSATRKVVLENLGRSTAEVKLYLEDRNTQGKKRRHPRSNKSWIHLGVSKVKLAAGEKKSISYRVQVPNGKYRGTYWSNIIVEPLRKDSKESTQSQAKDGFKVFLKHRTRYVIAVMTHFDGEAKYQFSGPKMETNEKKQKVFAINVKNLGIRHGYFDTRLDVFDQSGKQVTTLASIRRGAYPQVTKRINISLQTLKPGKYKALLSLEDVHSGNTVGTDINLSVLH